MKKSPKNLKESSADMTSRVAETFNNIEIIKANHSQNYEFKRFKKDTFESF